MSIKIRKSELKNLVKEEVMSTLNEEAAEMTRDGVERMKDLAYQIAKKLAREIDQASMSQQLDGQRLLAAVIDQVKLQMKE